MMEDVIEALRVTVEPGVGDFDHAAWAEARPAPLVSYWSGEAAPAGRHAEARLLWNDEALSVRFVCRQTEPLVVAAAPDVERKTVGLWDRDVCEIFLAPETRAPERYFEFEAAPTGEWLDVGIVWRPEGRETDWQYQSGMRTASRIAEGFVTTIIRVPFSAVSRRPRAGERWRANLFRCVGEGRERGYLTWRPTLAPEPNFHVPQKFGWLEFKG